MRAATRLRQQASKHGIITTQFQKLYPNRRTNEKVRALSHFTLLIVLVGARQVVADEVTKWNEIAGKAAFESGLSNLGPLESRVYAMTHAAIHDALNAIDRRSQPYALNIPFRLDASPEVAVATAAHRVLVDQFNRIIA